MADLSNYDAPSVDYRMWNTSDLAKYQDVSQGAKDELARRMANNRPSGLPPVAAPQTALTSKPIAQTNDGPKALPDPNLSKNPADYSSPGLEAADATMHLSPQEKYLYQTGLKNQSTAPVQNPNGSISTLKQASVTIDGRAYNIPTIWDGQEHTIDEAVNHAKTLGLDKFPSYGSVAQAEARYQQLHKFISQDAANVGMPPIGDVPANPTGPTNFQQIGAAAQPAVDALSPTPDAVRARYAQMYPNGMAQPAGPGGINAMKAAMPGAPTLPDWANGVPAQNVNGLQPGTGAPPTGWEAIKNWWQNANKNPAFAQAVGVPQSVQDRINSGLAAFHNAIGGGAPAPAPNNPNAIAPQDEPPGTRMGPYGPPAPIRQQIENAPQGAPVPGPKPPYAPPPVNMTVNTDQNVGMGGQGGIGGFLSNMSPQTRDALMRLGVNIMAASGPTPGYRAMTPLMSAIGKGAEATLKQTDKNAAGAARLASAEKIAAAKNAVRREGYGVQRDIANQRILQQQRRMAFDANQKALDRTIKGMQISAENRGRVANIRKTYDPLIASAATDAEAAQLKTERDGMIRSLGITVPQVRQAKGPDGKMHFFTVGSDGKPREVR